MSKTKVPLKINKEWINAHLTEELADEVYEPIDFFKGIYVDGLTVMFEDDSHEADITVFEAENEEELLYWQFETVCWRLKGRGRPSDKTWRYYPKYEKKGKWYYTEHRSYDFNAIENPFLSEIECYLRNLKNGIPAEQWEKRIEACMLMINRGFSIPHWKYDKGDLCIKEYFRVNEYFDQYEQSKKRRREEPRYDSIVEIID